MATRSVSCQPWQVERGSAGHSPAVRHARRDLRARPGEYPRECMGMIGGVGDELIDLYRMVNTSEIDKAYADDPIENIEVGEMMDARGQLPLVIYHSHPGTEAYFSPTDERVAREGLWGADRLHRRLDQTGRRSVYEGVSYSVR
ncbi:MAG: Mov34/MPN/PAD-1 family protein [Thermomicrobiales bacterium]